MNPGEEYVTGWLSDGRCVYFASYTPLYPTIKRAIDRGKKKVWITNTYLGGYPRRLTRLEHGIWPQEVSEAD